MVLVVTTMATVEPLRVVGFNVASGGARPDVVATFIATRHAKICSVGV